eukprot:gene353-378_t
MESVESGGESSTRNLFSILELRLLREMLGYDPDDFNAVRSNPRPVSMPSESSDITQSMMAELKFHSSSSKSKTNNAQLLAEAARMLQSVELDRSHLEKKLRETAAQAAINICELQTKLQESENDKQILEKQMSDLHQEIKAITIRYNTAISTKNNQQETFQDHMKTINNLTIENKAMKTTIIIQEKEQNTLKHQTQRLTEELSEQKKQISILEEKVQLLCVDVEEARGLLLKEQEEVGRLSSAKKALEEQVVLLDADYRSLKGLLLKEQEEVGRLSSAKKVLEEQVVLLDADYRSSEDEKERLSVELTALKEHVHDVESRDAEKSLSLKGLEEKVQLLCVDVEEARSLLLKEQEEVGRLSNADYRSSEDEKERLSVELTALKEHVHDVESRDAEKSLSLKGLEEKVQLLCVDVEEARSLLLKEQEEVGRLSSAKKALEDLVVSLQAFPKDDDGSAGRIAALEEALSAYEEKEALRVEAEKIAQAEMEASFSSIEENKHDAEFLLQQLILTKVNYASLSQDLELYKLKLAKANANVRQMTIDTSESKLPPTPPRKRTPSSATSVQTRTSRASSKSSEQGWKFSFDVLNLGINDNNNNNHNRSFSSSSNHKK